MRSTRSLALLLSLLLWLGAAAPVPAQVPTIAGHPARIDAAGRLLPWTSWTVALDREMRFYQGCPMDHGYPRFVGMTFLDGSWSPDPKRTDSIPATQDGMGSPQPGPLSAGTARGRRRQLAG